MIIFLYAYIIFQRVWRKWRYLPYINCGYDSIAIKIN